MRTVSKVDVVGTHLSEQEVITDAFANNEANTQDIERVKFGSNKICIREDLAEEKMVFSQVFNAHHAYITYLKVHLSANAEN